MLNKTKWTPGPWTWAIEDRRPTARKGNRAPVAVVRGADGSSVAHVWGNEEAPIIAAASEMYAAHGWLMANGAEHSPWLDDHARHCDGCQRYLAAYAKADGGAP